MMIIDTHAHLDHLEDPTSALARAVEAQVRAIVAVSMDLNSCRKNLTWTAMPEGVALNVALGMHPSEVAIDEVEPILALIKEHHKSLIAVGEIGLDFWYKWVNKDEAKQQEQMNVYRMFLEAAKIYDLPAIIHSRGAWQQCLDIATEVGVTKAIFHWYSGPVDVLRGILDAGYYVSTTPSLAYSIPSREAMAFAPIEQTLIETDCPVYYSHLRLVDGVPKRAKDGFNAEPKDVWKTLEAYCALRGLERDKALCQFNQNARDVFMGLKET